MLRTAHVHAVEALLRRHRSVAILGARQVGKTTLARAIAARARGTVAFYDLENDRDLARLEAPLLTLGEHRGLVILDEVQRRPDLFAALRVLIDRPRAPRFLLLGSASPELLRQSSETLAGRVFYYPLRGFSVAETGARQLDRLWLRGGFPRSFLARSETQSREWRQAFIATFLERDVPQLGEAIPALTLRRFWNMLAHYHGQVWNGAEFSRSFGVSHHTVRRYLDLLAATFMVDVLAPWHENLGKRQIRAPKVYLSDSGLLHSLLGIEDRSALEGHPKVGASWEGFLLQQVVARLSARPQECYYWATYSGAELDLLVVRGRQRRGFEFKRTDAPRLTRSMDSAIADLKPDLLEVVHAGEHSFQLAHRVRAVAAHRLLDDIEPLR